MSRWNALENCVATDMICRDDGDLFMLVYRLSECLGWLILLFLLIAGLPLLICMPLWADATLYDLAARNILWGGVHYRDIFETNLPGMVWLHLGIRSLFGWRSEPLCAVDFAVVTAIIWLLIAWLRGLGLSRAARLWTAVTLYLYYFSTSEWCHCQRDVWMMVPALLALNLRRRQLAEVTDTSLSTRFRVQRALAEGVCWGAAFWIKPYVAIPAVSCWILSLILWRRMPRTERRQSAIREAFGILAGGVAAGLPGVIWLVWSGSWRPFWNIMLHWNPEYYANSIPAIVRPIDTLFARHEPWNLLHFVAVSIGVCALWKCVSQERNTDGHVRAAAQSRGLFSAFYIGWALQAFVLQNFAEYLFVPPVMLAATLIIDLMFQPRRSLAWAAVFGCFFAFALIKHPLAQNDRLASWERCWREGSTPQMRDKLSLIRSDSNPGWVELERVAEYLRSKGVGDGELTCYDNSSHPLYLDLGIRPSTPYIHFGPVLLFFRARRQMVFERLAASPQRYVVSNMEILPRKFRPAADEWPDSSLELPANFPEQSKAAFPFSRPIVFHAGRYTVHAVQRENGDRGTRPMR